MCLITVRWAFEQTDLPHAEHFVLLALANCLNSKTLLCCPSLHTLGKVTGLSRRKIAYCLRQLESLGYIETSTRHEKIDRGPVSTPCMLCRVGVHAVQP